MSLVLLVLKIPTLFRYNNPDHVTFNKVVSGICNKYAQIIGDEGLVTAYAAKVQQEDNVFKWIRKSDFTAKKAEADHARDKTSLSLIQMVRVNLRHFDPAIRDAAVHVNNLLENYGEFRKANYDAETAAIDSIVTRLKSPGYSTAVDFLKLTLWVDKLEAENTLFKSFASDASEEKIDRPAISTVVARRETDDSLHPIINRVTSLINLNGPEAYVAFVEEFNTEVKHYNTLVNEHYGRLHARFDIATAIIGVIAPQPATGKPLFVIPEVSLRSNKDGVDETVELVFSVDFTVAYKNNVTPGTATLTITGIGKYKGQVVTTFNII
jgi:hypothetical protein